jgi:carbon monoxide dehydrogenase subunit G
MKIEGEYTFNGPRQEVWSLVRDPEVLATCLPGTQRLEKVSDNEYTGEMNVRVGPVAGAFAGRLLVSDEVQPESMTLTVEGKGAPGFANGVGHVRLVEQEDGTTLMRYEGEMQIGGKLASVGQRLLDTASKSLIRQGLEALDAALQARLAAQATGAEVEYTPPSEAQFARGVARDVMADMLPPRTLGLMALAALLGLIVGYLLGRKGGCCVQE